MLTRQLLCAVFLLTCPPLLWGQTAAEKVELREQLTQLEAHIGQLKPAQRVDAEICTKAVDWILRHDEFYKPNDLKSAQATLKLGKARAQSLIAGDGHWGKEPGIHALGYRSRIDESVQPYLLTLPKGYQANSPQRWPLYVVLHGRNATLTEASFISGKEGKPAPEQQTWIQLDVFGRVNNAYRWAGETDVFEALDDVIRRCKIDESRITLWGFSMGGAGVWHLALQHPSQWASAGAGAGFVDFYIYQKQSQQLPEHQHKALRIYDALDYASNLQLLPFVAYGGEVDPQLQSALLMQAAAEKFGVPLNLIVGPKMGHKFDDVSQAKFMEFLGQHNQAGRQRVPGKRELDFTTYTLKYPKCEWLEIKEQTVAYDKTRVQSTIGDDGTLLVETENVAAMSILRPTADRVSIDGAGPFDLNVAEDANLLEVFFVKHARDWEVLNYEDSLDFVKNLDGNKRHNLQGPIDDAFMEAFVCVAGTGPPWSAELQSYADWSLSRFQREFDKWMRAQPIVIQDIDIDAGTISTKNLVLFGDPGSNRLIAQMIAELPLVWTTETLTYQGQEYSTKDHCVVLIFPNPLNPERYVVINSGMTMHEADFKASNSWLFPKLGDHALIQFAPDKDQGFRENVLKAGLYDANWNH